MAHDELLRIYTREGEPTNAFKKRGEVHRDGDWHATVHLWMINSSRQLLFQKRSHSAELHPGLWDVSAAGHVVDDDSLEMSLERESLEELGVAINAQQAQWLFTLQTELHKQALHERVFQYVYLLNRDIDQHELNLQVEEVAEVQWHHYSLLQRLISDSSGFVPRTDEYTQLLGHLKNSAKVSPRPGAAQD